MTVRSVRNPYTEEEKAKICDEIFERMAQGESVSDILRADNMPTTVTFLRWRDNSEELSSKYERAKLACEEFYSDEILRVARDLTKTVHDRRIEIDALKWVSSRIRGGYAKPDKDDTAPVTQADLELSLAEVISALKGDK